MESGKVDQRLPNEFKIPRAMNRLFVLVILLILILTISCGHSPDLVVKDSGQMSRVQIFEGIVLQVSASEIRSKLLIPIYVRSTDMSYIYPYHMSIIVRGNPWNYVIVSRDQNYVAQDSVEVTPEMITFAYTDGSNTGFKLKKGDEVLLWGNEYIKHNGEFYNLDTLVFVVP